MKCLVEDITIVGGVPGFMGASCSGIVFSAPLVSVSMLVARRGAKKLASFGGSLKAVVLGLT
jgi:hypothetical protein